jgi:hypothetical protein
MTIKQIAQMKPTIVNDRSNGKYRFILAITYAGSVLFLVYADCLQDAIDNLVDEKGDSFPGFFADADDTEAYWNENSPDHAYAQDSYFPAGNSGELFTNEISVLSEQRKGR